MKVLVVYESMFGNTAAIATAVAHGLTRGGAHVELYEVGTAPSARSFDLIVAGGPTQVFSLSRPSTRADAIAKGATQGSAEFGLREWLERLPEADPLQRFAAFDTRLGSSRLPGSAAAKTLRITRKLGYPSLARQSFMVTSTSGPLLAGELERAEAWGAMLVPALIDGWPTTEEQRWQSPAN